MLKKLFVPRFSLFAVVVVCCGAVISGCARHTQPYPPPPPPFASPVPIIRVRLTQRRAESTELRSVGGYRLKLDGLVVAESKSSMEKTTLRRSGQTWKFGEKIFTGDKLILEPAEDSMVGLGKVLYRGNLQAKPSGKDRLVVVNYVDVESYLAGVLAAELYHGWNIQTYRALAVAARTFAMYHVITINSSVPFDLGSDQGAQVYRGLGGETEKAWRAVRSTHGVVLAHGPLDNERIFLAQYSACCGGVVNGAQVLRDARNIKPLAGGQVCDDCRKCSRYRWPDVTVPKNKIYRALVSRYSDARKLGALASIRVVWATDSGRAVWLELVGTSGRTMRIRAERLRALISAGIDFPRSKPRLWSMNCRIQNRGSDIVFADGRGFGHGVGLCQWGAQGKAERGWSAERILEFYYPKSRRFRVY